MTTRMKTMMGVLAAVVGTLTAVAAQQPAAAPTPTPAAVIEALKRPTAPPDAAPTGTTEDEASMAAVLARYGKMIVAGEAAPVPTPSPAARPARWTGTATTARPVPQPTPETSTGTPTDDTLDAVRTDLQAIVSRLDVLARKGGQ